MKNPVPYALVCVLVVVLASAPARAQNVINVFSHSGVMDADGVTPLQGEGTLSPTSHKVQFIYAGANASIQLPDAAGLPTGDDQLIGSTLIGEGFPFNANEGKFFATFNHSLSTGSKVYVRAWNSHLTGAGAKYGESVLYSISNVISPTEDFDSGTWSTSKSIHSSEGMPLMDAAALGLLGVVLTAAAVRRVRRDDTAGGGLPPPRH
jgi:hypothetical protein